MLKPLYFIRKIIAVLCTFFYMLPGAAPAGYDAPESDDWKMTAVVLADIQVESTVPEELRIAGETFRGVWADGRIPDVVAHCGDMTMCDQKIEQFDFYGLLNRYYRGGELVFCFGNHDFDSEENQPGVRPANKAINLFNQYTGNNIDNVYYSKTVKGYKFIVLGSENNTRDMMQHITDAQVEWLKAELAECAENGLPAFIVNHNPIGARNGMSDGNGTGTSDNNEALRNALETSGVTTVYFCGHTHAALGPKTIETVGNVTYVNVPGAGTVNDPFGDYGVGCQMDVYGSKIVLRMRSFVAGRYETGYDNYEIPLGAD